MTEGIMERAEHIRRIIQSRAELVKGLLPLRMEKREEEGGCGVTGFACSVPVRGKHIFEPSRQMHNRGNGRGGGIAAMGFDHKMLGVSRDVLEQDYILQIALLEEGVMGELEKRFIEPVFEVHSSGPLPHVDDYRDIPGLEVRPPDVWRYFVRVKPHVLTEFVEKNQLQDLKERQAEDEFVYQNSFRINKAFYDAYGKQQAFVLSHGRNFFILKIVGYAEQVVQYYKLDNFKAHIWIAHQRYPTKGKVWHPGGAHPFIGMNEALVHNGDFANYYSVAEYLKQRNIYPLFLTDTEVSVLLFDLYSRVYGYPLEYVIEALAPTMERDFDQLPPEKRDVYGAIQATHIHGSPDGPWFFIIARNDTVKQRFQLIGITDTAMLRPQVFALHDGQVQVGLICSEKQAIDATLRSLADEDPRAGTVADRYWNARGGSHTDGGAFIFNLDPIPGNDTERKLTCIDKFGREVKIPQGQVPYLPGRVYYTLDTTEGNRFDLRRFFDLQRPDLLIDFIKNGIKDWDYANLVDCLKEIKKWTLENDAYFEVALEAITHLIDRRYPTFDKKRRSVLQILNHALENIFRHFPSLQTEKADTGYRLIDWETRQFFRGPSYDEKVLIIDATLFPPEGDHCDSRLMAEAYFRGWRRFIVFGLRGQRFHGCGFGPSSGGVRIDIYGSPGDYLGSGIDGMSIYVHSNAQDQLGQIMKSGKLVIYGDTGQTFMYGAKGGEVYVMGNAAGRPLINAVGKPRVVINGTCLDYLAESFMAGDPLHGGGFVILNGMTFDDEGNVVPQAIPYPGSNLFSLASGGAIYVRDPHCQIEEQQLNGGEIVPITEKDWELILPYLQENERLFGISIEEDLLKVEGQRLNPLEIYRKVRPEGKGDIKSDGLEEWGE
ncbi:MAG TPA: glutamate synthase [Desulfobacteraceae bacterium]|nr:glutamate synthase [Deltaproteobacteria bacterium]HDM09353.1 glutamate synthase [Desulfobacteraceae bacterium]